MTEIAKFSYPRGTTDATQDLTFAITKSDWKGHDRNAFNCVGVRAMKRAFKAKDVRWCRTIVAVQFKAGEQYVRFKMGAKAKKLVDMVDTEEAEVVGMLVTLKAPKPKEKIATKRSQRSYSVREITPMADFKAITAKRVAEANEKVHRNCSQILYKAKDKKG